MSGFFRRLIRMKKSEAERTERNEYYENISANLGIFQVILYLSLFAFVILSFAKNTSLITYHNFYYFFKDLNASSQTVDISADSVTYPTDVTQSFTLFRKGLAVAGNKNLTVFTATGRQTVASMHHYTNPTAIASDKYLLVYDFGGTQFSLYNSYTRVYEGKSDYPLFGAAISDAGSFALITQSEKHASVVLLYNNNFSLIGRYNKTGYVTGISINPRGTLLAIMTSRTENGFWSTELELFKPGESAAQIQKEVASSVGLTCEFTANDTVAVLCSGGLLHVNAKGEIRERYDFSGQTIAQFYLGEDGAVLCLQAESVSLRDTLVVFDRNGAIRYQNELPEKAEQITRSGNRIFMLTTNGVGCLDISNRKYLFENRSTRQACILAIDADTVLICTPQKAEYCEFVS